MPLLWCTFGMGELMKKLHLTFHLELIELLKSAKKVYAQCANIPAESVKPTSVLKLALQHYINTYAAESKRLKQ